MQDSKEEEEGTLVQWKKVSSIHSHERAREGGREREFLCLSSYFLIIFKFFLFL